MLNKIKEEFESKHLVGEVFTTEDTPYGFRLTISLKKNILNFQNESTYLTDYDNTLTVISQDFANINKVFEIWRNVRSSLHAYVERGALFVGHTGYDYYRPNSRKYRSYGKEYNVTSEQRPTTSKVLGLDRLGEIFENDNKTGEIYSLDHDLTVKVKRFELTFFRKKGALILQSQLVNAFEEGIELWKERQLKYQN
ncbi:MAG: hypothetical protein OK457_05695 [Thaumarchaeota archaeon]|nr:hypothetical protein [Nitrososphaerota archaeon]